MPQHSRSASLLAALLACVALVACGGHPPLPGDGTGDGGLDASSVGQQCQFDTDCNPGPPNFICGVSGLCEQGCTLNPSCPVGQVCNSGTGRCVVGISPDAGIDGGTDAGGDGGAGTPSDTLCRACSPTNGNADCHSGGQCVQDSSHTAYFCTQDCTTATCPNGYVCLADRSGAQHQCYPLAGNCNAVNGTPDGGTADAGPVNDPTVPSTNAGGCGFCGHCNVNNDCFSGSVCVNGYCATGPCVSNSDCQQHHGGFLGSCTSIPGIPNMYCTPTLGACNLIPQLGGLNGDVTCQPSTVSTCAAPTVPAPSLGGNVAVTTSLSPKPQIAYDPSIVATSTGALAVAFIGLDASSNSFVGLQQSTTSGTTGSWVSKTIVSGSSGTQQSDPSLVVSKWTDAAVVHERMHAAWVAYSLNANGNIINPAVESSYSDDAGATWHASVRITTASDTSNGTLGIDKPSIAVSNDASQKLLVTFALGTGGTQHVYGATSADHGATWHAKVALEASTDANGRDFAAATFDPSDASGKTIYAAYVSYAGNAASSNNSVFLVRSADAGATWSAPFQVTVSGEQVLLDPISIAIDAAHHLFIGYASSPSGGSPLFWDAMVAALDVTSPTAPVQSHHTRVSDDQGNCFQHFHVQLAVNRANGTVYAAFLDNRSAGKGAAWYAASADTGTTFQANKRVNDTDFDFSGDGQQAGFKFLGDYFGLFFDGANLRIAWSDPRDGTSSQIFYVGGAP